MWHIIFSEEKLQKKFFEKKMIFFVQNNINS